MKAVYMLAAISKCVMLDIPRKQSLSLVAYLKVPLPPFLFSIVMTMLLYSVCQISF